MFKRIFLFTICFLTVGSLAPIVFAEKLGDRVSILDASLDASTYKKGETLRANINWEAHNFQAISRNNKIGEGEGLSIDMIVSGLDGSSCAAPVTETLFAEDTKLVLDAAIIADCPVPQARITLIDASGQLLEAVVAKTPTDQTSPAIPTVVRTVDPLTINQNDYNYTPLQIEQSKAASLKRTRIIYAGITAGIFLIVIIGLLVLRRKK